MVLGCIIGHYFPDMGTKLSPLSTAFLKLIKSFVGVVIFYTIVSGVVQIGREASVGRIGLKFFLYFEVVTTIAMIFGMVMVNIFEPGTGMGVDSGALDTQAVSSLRSAAEHSDTVTWLLSIIPATFVGAFARGEILPILLLALMFGFALIQIGGRAEPVLGVIDSISDAIFRMAGMVMCLGPVAVFGAVSFSVSKYGIASALPLMKFLVFALRVLHHI